ncbi:hypothetical protein D3C83_11850 [compost metagenome]
MRKKLPSSDAPSLPHTSLAEKSVLRLSRLPNCERNSNVRGRGRALTTLMTPPIA